MEDKIIEAVRAARGFAVATIASTGAKKSALALFEPTSSPSCDIQVEVSYLQAPVPNRVPIYIKLPNNVTTTHNLCLVTPAPQRKYKDELMDAGHESSVAKIIDVVKLKAKYSNPVARRALAKAFDAFFIHSDLKEFPKLLTGEFLTWRTPVWMDHKTKSIKEKIEVSRRIAVLPRRGFDNICVTVGNSSQSAEEVAENALELSKQLLKMTDQKILTLRLSVTNAVGQRVCLPFYAHDFSLEIGQQQQAGIKRPRGVNE